MDDEPSLAARMRSAAGRPDLPRAPPSVKRVRCPRCRTEHRVAAAPGTRYVCAACGFTAPLP